MAELPSEQFEAPTDTGRSFFVNLESRLGTNEFPLPTLEQIEGFDPGDYRQHDAYTRYVRMHKVLVGEGGAHQLKQIYEDLKDDVLPRHLWVAGWAMAEAALVLQKEPIEKRLEMLDTAVSTWQRAYLVQDYVERMAPDVKIEYDKKSRLALDIAISPLLAGMISGNVKKETCEAVFKECLNIAEWNAVAIQLALKEGNYTAVNDLTGFAYECNALLSLNRWLSNTWFAIPAMARCDSGYYYRDQTHDLLVIRQRHGAIHNGTPVEIKGTPSRRDKERYRSLLVRGKMHLSVAGKYTPEHTLLAIGAVYRGDATQEEARIADTATSTFARMLRDYSAGKVLAVPVLRNTVTVFHDKTIVHENHPGLVEAVA